MNEIQRLIHEMCPDGVPMVALGEICEIRGRIGFRGYTRADQVAEGEGALSLSPGNITNGVIDYSKGTFITWKKYEESPEIITNNGDIIFCKTASCGKVAIVKNLPYKATINPQLVVLKNVACPVPYLYYYLSSNSIQECVKKLQGVGSVPNISQATLSSFQIPFPPLPIQQRIVDILDKFTSLVSSLDSEIALRQKQYEYYRNKLLSFEEGVKIISLGEVCEIKNGKDYKHLSSGNIPVWGTGGIMTYVDKYAYNGPSVLLPRKGSIDKVYYSEGPIWTVDTLFYTIINESIIDPKFLFNAISIQDLRALDTSKGNRPSLTQTVLNKIQIPLPPLSVQLSIVRTLDTFESLLTNLKKERELRQKQYEYYREKLLTFA